MEKAGKKNYTPLQAFNKAALYCAAQERCHQEVRSKLYDWGLHGEDVEQCIARLIGEGFINEERFSKAFAGGKFRIKKWGRVKIRMELKRRNISEYCIRKGLEEIPEYEYMETIKQLMKKKYADTHEKNPYKKLNRLASFVIGKGFESELVWDLAKELYAGHSH